MEIVYENPWFKVIKNVNFHHIEEVKSNGSSLLIKNKNEYVFVKVNRHSFNEDFIEIPRGFPEGDESPVETAKREAFEETGYNIDKEDIVFLGKMTPNSGILKSELNLFYVEVDCIKPKTFYDSGEVEKVIHISEDEIFQYIKEGIIKDSFTLSSFGILTLLKGKS